MKQILTTAFFILCISSIALAQKTTGKLLFEQGQALEITLQSKTTISQQAMGQAIDFNVDASGTHAYKVTNTCLLYTSDAADDLLCVDFGGRRSIKKKKTTVQHRRQSN